MIYAKVTPKEQIQLEQALKEAQASKWYRRLKIIHLSSQGRTVTELATMFDLSVTTIRRYIHQFNRYGINGLYPRIPPGRPAQLNWSRADWEQLLQRQPYEFKRLNSVEIEWTQALVVNYLAEYENIQVGQSAVSKTLKRLGVNWQYPNNNRQL